eukprot:CAMPEP_0174327382 /NCGR_PEP_ID=MMETSP0810-20121108/14482_1 /TAXON_ID=73025 ORGANISM="Eutreptiella gymnastica-like, Strain CCMP1594" /NCGR_SAMPLE_ID=MMETSP0810 /ASSEMBLY_ACC=CAM_ASM_000659 /LENGTH=56 /DNA_ID=CAMNT_0015441215 /DNA_START=736 /DNA_END=903 /DNA_ORIENTATION=+
MHKEGGDGGHTSHAVIELHHSRWCNGWLGFPDGSGGRGTWREDGFGTSKGTQSPRT